MKKSKLLLALALVFLFTFFALGSGEEASDVDQGSGSVSSSETSDENIGDYKVEIDSCRLAEDYEGNPVVIVKYIFTNVNDDDSIAFWTAFDDEVFQDGVGLNEAFVLDDSANYSSDNQMKEIKKGASIDVEVAYELNDTTTDIVVEVKELISWDDTVVTRTFSITE